jgi:NhaA family Na+:H+ antiporter
MAGRSADQGVLAALPGQLQPLPGEDLFTRFFHWEAAGSIILLCATVLAMVWANSPWAGSYFHLAHVPIGVSFGEGAFEMSLQHWVNDLLMAVFFFVVGLEIKRELITGELSSFRKAVLPVTAAVGGLLAPAGIYAYLNAGGPASHGWGIPMATDIAFAIGILAMFGKRVPVGLKVFLTALAIADDVGAVLVVAVFYTGTLRVAPLVLSAAVLALAAFFVRSGIRRVGLYIILGLLIWVGVFASKLHATIAGILLASVIPVRAPEEGQQSAGEAIEEYLHPTVAFVILPLFALFNAGVSLEKRVTEVLLRPMSLGIVLGLVLGKQIGIVLFSWIPVKARLAVLPERVSWSQMYGSACLAGIGFTMSLFITDLAFEDPALSAEAKVGILVASLVAAGWAAVVLHRSLPRSSEPIER